MLRMGSDVEDPGDGVQAGDQHVHVVCVGYEEYDLVVATLRPGHSDGYRCVDHVGGTGLPA